MSWNMLTPFGRSSFLQPEDFVSSLQSELNRALRPGHAPLDAASCGLMMDVKEDEEAFHVLADLPGLSEKEVEITFEDGLLTIRGEKKLERESEQDKWHIMERSSGSFVRQLRLPISIDADKIDAKVEHGVLTVTLPKTVDDAKAVHKIEVKKG